MIGSDSVREVVICPSCGADEMGCAVKLGLGGRPCCDDCEGPQSHEGEDLVRHDGEDLVHHEADR